MKGVTLFKLLRYWPPYWGTGIRVKEVSPDLSYVKVEMKMRFWNKNYVGVHFGGSLYSMTDPFYMLILLEKLGKDYIVWDKSAKINFIKPGKGTVSAEFIVTEEVMNKIKEVPDSEYKYEPTFLVKIKDSDGEVVAEVEKELYIRKK